MMKKILFLFLVVSQFLCLNYAQERRFLNKLDSSHLAERSASAQLIFNEIESGISKGSVSKLSKYLDSQTYFSLSNGVSGYYSANQAFYVLEDYFKLYQVISFRLKNIKAMGESPYATGEYYYELKGKKDTAQVYISLKLSGNNWKITQITIN